MRSSSLARAAAVLGALAVLAVPAGVAASQFVANLTLLESLWASVPASILLGLVAVGIARRARFAAARSVYPDAGRGVGAARVLAWAGVYVGVVAGIALAVYGALRWAQ